MAVSKPGGLALTNVARAGAYHVMAGEGPLSASFFAARCNIVGVDLCRYDAMDPAVRQAFRGLVLQHFLFWLTVVCWLPVRRSCRTPGF